MKYLLLLSLILCSCANRGPAYYSAAPSYYPQNAILFHGDMTRLPDFFFGDGQGGGMLMHGDMTQLPDFVSGF